MAQVYIIAFNGELRYNVANGDIFRSFLSYTGDTQMNHDLLHIQGKPFVLVPLHEYRIMSGANDDDAGLPDHILDEIHAGRDSAIKIIRKFRGMTQAELAKKTGLSRPYLAEIETRKKNGSLKALKEIAKTLEAPMGLLAR